MLNSVYRRADMSPEQHRARLFHRLDQGWERIERGVAEGLDVAQWEELWLALLGEYERTCDQLAGSETAEIAIKAR